MFELLEAPAELTELAPDAVTATVVAVASVTVPPVFLTKFKFKVRVPVAAVTVTLAASFVNVKLDKTFEPMVSVPLVPASDTVVKTLVGVEAAVPMSVIASLAPPDITTVVAPLVYTVYVPPP